jgi:hypothetical protein
MMIGTDPFGPLSKTSLLENRHRQSFLAQAHYRIFGLKAVIHGSEADFGFGS